MSISSINNKDQNNNKRKKNWYKRRSDLQESAGREMVILLDKWKKSRRRLRIYRTCLCAALLCGCIALGGVGYYNLYEQIPSVLRIKAGEEQEINLGVPMTGEVRAVSEQGESNIPAGAVTIDLNQSVSVRMSNSAEYKMLVRLFGFLPFKEVGIQVIDSQELTPVGAPVGIYVKADGLLVIGVGEFKGMDGITYSPARYVLQSGDYIQALNGEAVSNRNDFIRRIEAGDGSPVVLSVLRGEQELKLEVQPVKNESGEYKLGVWIRDNAQGVGTMTYIDADGNFGALGHGINDVDTSTLMSLQDGTLYQTEIISIQKGENGNPGEMTGMIVYSESRILGDIDYNGSQGIFGTCNDKALAMATEDALPIGLKQEIQTGPAQILCTVDREPEYYDVEITAVHLDHDNVNRGIELKVTDPELIALTGGIVQGMSGAPIIQNGKFIGAVTHVLVNDSTRGYGIFIENMLEH